MHPERHDCHLAGCVLVAKAFRLQFVGELCRREGRYRSDGPAGPILINAGKGRGPSSASLTCSARGACPFARNFSCSSTTPSNTDVALAQKLSTCPLAICVR